MSNFEDPILNVSLSENPEQPLNAYWSTFDNESSNSNVPVKLEHPAKAYL